MTFSLYQSFIAVPHDLREAARMYHLTPWQSFWQLEVPFAMPQLIWNMMMSVSGGWFFVVASEASPSPATPYCCRASAPTSRSRSISAILRAVLYAILAMLVLILLYDQLLFRPLLAWAQRFKFEEIGEDEIESPWFLIMMQRAQVVRLLTPQRRCRRLTAEPRHPPLAAPDPAAAIGAAAFGLARHGCGTVSSLLVALFALYEICALRPCRGRAGARSAACRRARLPHPDPRDGADRCSPRSSGCRSACGSGCGRALAHRVQPMIQFLAAFPANLFFPIVVIGDRRAEAQSRDLAVAADDPRHAVVHPLQRHRRHPGAADRLSVSSPAISACATGCGGGGWCCRRSSRPIVTGAVTASGGSWNASIVAEIVQMGRHHADSDRHRRLYRRSRRQKGTSRASRSALRCCASIVLAVQSAAVAAALSPRRGAPAARLIG